MGALRRLLPWATPMGRVGVAMWAWRNRSAIAGWAGYAAKAVPKLTAGDTGDVLTEGRLRVRLTSDARTRGVEGLDVAVADGIATLTGTVPADVHDAAIEVAAGTPGVVRVRDELEDLRRRRGRSRFSGR